MIAHLAGRPAASELQRQPAKTYVSHPPRLSQTRACIVASIVGLALTVVASGQPFGDDDEVRRHGIFVDSLDVNLINLEVRVTRDGEPVRDLTADDFEILDDGEPVEIRHFYEVEGGQRQSPSPSPPTDSEASPASDSTLRALEPTIEPSSIVVLVDQAFISPMSRKLVFDQLTDKLDRLMDDGTRVMIVSKHREVEIVQPLTAGRAEIQTALDSLAGVATGNYAAEVRNVIQSIEQRTVAASSRQSGPGSSSAALASTARSDAQAAFLDAQNHSQRQHAEVTASLRLLRSFVGSLAGLPGRKAVLYVADRLPVRSGELAWRVWFEKFGLDWGSQLGATSLEAALTDYDSTTAIHDLVADANANRIAFYPVGVGADAGPNLMGAESRGLRTPNRTFSRVSESNGGLRWLARGSGGRAAIGRGDVGAFFDGLNQDLTHYYSLAYPSPHRGDGDTHKVEIRLRSSQDPVGDDDGPPIELRYLGEYRDKSADQQMIDRTLSAMMLGDGENPLDVRVDVGDPKEQKGGTFRVPLTLRVPVANLVLIPGKSAQQGRMSIQLIVRDEAGRFSDPVKIDLPIEIPHRGLLQALSESAAYPTAVTLRPGRQTLGVGVRDEFGDIHSTVHVRVDVGGRG